MVFNHLNAISIPTLIEVELSAFPIVTISNNSGVFEASGNYPSYQWYLDGQPIQGENQSQLIPTSLGEYTVKATNDEGCSALSEPLLAVTVDEQFHSFPNIETIKVFDAMGRLVNVFGNSREFANQNWALYQLLFIQYFDAEQNLLGTEKKLTSVF